MALYVAPKDDYRSGLKSILSSLDDDKRLCGVYKKICNVCNPMPLPREEYIERILKDTVPGSAYKVLGRKWITKLLITKYLEEKGQAAEDDLKVTGILECLKFWDCPRWKEGETFQCLKSAGRWNGSDPHPMRQVCERAGKITLYGTEWRLVRHPYGTEWRPVQHPYGTEWRPVQHLYGTVQNVERYLFDQISAGLHWGVEEVKVVEGTTVFRVSSDDGGQSEVLVKEEWIESIAIRRNVVAYFDALNLSDD